MNGFPSVLLAVSSSSKHSLLEEGSRLQDSQAQETPKIQRASIRSCKQLLASRRLSGGGLLPKSHTDSTRDTSAFESPMLLGVDPIRPLVHPARLGWVHFSDLSLVLSILDACPHLPRKVTPQSMFLLSVSTSRHFCPSLRNLYLPWSYTFSRQPITRLPYSDPYFHIYLTWLPTGKQSPDWFQWFVLIFKANLRNHEEKSIFPQEML